MQKVIILFLILLKQFLRFANTGKNRAAAFVCAIANIQLFNLFHIITSLKMLIYCWAVYNLCFL